MKAHTLVPAVFFIAILSALPAPCRTPDNTLSKEYRRAATVAKTSLDSWLALAYAVADSRSYSLREGSVYVSRSASEREADAGRKAAQDVRLAKIEVSTAGDKLFQTKLETYLRTLNMMNDSILSRERMTRGVSSTYGQCRAMLEKALDDGSATVFANYPQECDLAFATSANSNPRDLALQQLREEKSFLTTQGKQWLGLVDDFMRLHRANPTDPELRPRMERILQLSLELAAHSEKFSEIADSNRSYLRDSDAEEFEDVARLSAEIAEKSKEVKALVGK